MVSKGKVQELVSAGGVVYRQTPEEGLQIVLCGRRDPQTWSLPKGTPDEGETVEQTAMREVREETGLEPKIEERLGSINYWFARASENARFHKTVHYFLMSPVGGDISLHDPEFDDIQWFSVDEAMKKMTYENEVQVIRWALDALGKRGALHG